MHRSTRVVSAAVTLAMAISIGACSGKSESPTGSQSPGDTRSSEHPTTKSDAGTNPSESGNSANGVSNIELVEVAQLDAPVAMATRSGTDDLYVAEQGGVVRRLTPDDEGGALEVHDAPVLDIQRQTEASGEQGLLGLAFSPSGDRLYVDYTDRDGDTRIVEYPMDGDRADTLGARELLRVDQPSDNHNGGQLAFGPDGYLYIGMGDGGPGGDPDNTAQNNRLLLGKILRIDPSGSSGETPYRIPSDNPFRRNADSRPEIWITGVRNPWRFSFDSKTGDLWVADVGQDEWEEINRLPANSEGAGRGANLGWSVFEGRHRFEGSDSDAMGDDLTQPIYEYPHANSRCTVIGGYVYRGSAVPALGGHYVFGDFCSGEVFALGPVDAIPDDAQLSDLVTLSVPLGEYSLASFGQSNDGEIYVLTTDGVVYRITQR